MILTKEQIQELEKIAKPLAEYLEQFPPETMVIVEAQKVEFFEGKCGIPLISQSSKKRETKEEELPLG